MKGAKTLFSSASDEWSTPQDLFDWLNFMFQFTLDPCATPENAKVKKYFTKPDNGLVKSWSRERVFCNPPYSEVELWAQKAATEADTAGALVALLVPARTDTKWFQKYCIGRAIIFLKGRLKFGGHKNSAPFPSVVVLFLPQRST